MFDVGFLELLFIAIIALIFVGPEDMPGLVKGVFSTVSKFKRSISELMSGLQKEMEIDEIKAQIQKPILDEMMEDELKDMSNIECDIQETMDAVSKKIKPEEKKS